MNSNRNECKELKDESSKSLAGFWEYHGLARDGINLLLNNGFEESQRLFRSHRLVTRLFADLMRVLKHSFCR